MTDPAGCSCCISRRQCLKALSATALGAGIASPAAALSWMSRPGETDFIDPASLRPKPKVRVRAAVLRMPEPVWLGWPGTTYDLEGHRKEYLEQLDQSSRRLLLETTVEPAPIEDDAGVEGLRAKVRGEQPDGLLLILQHMSCWRWAHRLAQDTGVPLLVFAPIGTAFTGHVRNLSRQTGVQVVSSLEWSAVEAGLRMIRAKRMFEASRILWIRSDARNETVLDRLGTKVRAVPRKTFHELFETVPVNDEVREVAADLRRNALRIVEPTEEDTLNCARAYVTAKQLLAAENANALSMDCLGMVGARLVPTPPCGAWTLLQDQGITAGCEADLFGATSLMLTSYLLGRPGFMNDPVPETARNLLVAAHCTSGTRLNGFDEEPAPFILRDHSESDLGVSMQVLWPVDEPVTLVRFEGPGELIVDTGRVVGNIDTPPAGGCRTSVEIRMDRVEDVRDVRGFHQVVVLGDHRRELEAFCQLYGIDVLHSPERAPSRQEG